MIETVYILFLSQFCIMDSENDKPRYNKEKKS